MQVLRDLLKSKKFTTALATVVAMVGAKLGFPEAKVEELLALAIPLLVYVASQGVADHGKPPPPPPQAK